MSNVDILFVQGYKRRNAYIATQAPLKETVNDFWRMIWEKRLPIIVMLTNCNEADRVNLSYLNTCICKMLHLSGQGNTRVHIATAS